MQNVHFTTHHIATILGTNVSTIKRWIDKGVLPSYKTAGGHRRVTPKQWATFISSHPELTANSYILRRLPSTEETYNWRRAFELLQSPTSSDIEMYIQKILARNGMSVAHLCDTIIAPMLYHIGNEWQKGTLSIYEEHRLSFKIRSVLQSIDTLLPAPSPRARRAVLACIKNEYHELGIQMAGLVLKNNGWRAEIIGINTPTEEISKAMKSFRAQLLCVSKIYTTNPIREKEITTIAKKYKARLALGGRGWSGHEKNYFSTLHSFENFVQKKSTN